MLPVLFRIHLPAWVPLLPHELPIYSYGLMLVIGFYVAMQLGRYLARRSGLNAEHFVNACLIALISGVIGARLSHVLENLGEFTDPTRSAWENFMAMINIRSGGLTYYGGFLLAFPVTLAYGIHKKIPILKGMDVMAPCIMIGLGFGRIGCFLNGCCYGAQCNLPWAVEYPYYSNAYIDQTEAPNAALQVPPELQKIPGYDRRPLPLETIRTDPERTRLAAHEHARPVHPAQLYSTISAWLIAAILLAYYTMPHAAGAVFALMLLLEAPTRFILELLRVEPPVLGPFSVSMLISIALALLGAVMWVWINRSSRVDAALPRGARTAT